MMLRRATGFSLLLLPALLAGAPVLAQSDDDKSVAQLDLRRPGAPPRAAPDMPPQAIDPNAIPAPPPNANFELIPVPDRWRLMDSFGVTDSWFNPYRQGTLKGDRPIYDDYFINLSVISDSVFEPRSFPVPVGVSTTARRGSNSTFGRPEQLVFVQQLITSISLIKGDTVYKPPEFEFRLSPVFNFNHVQTEELGLVNIDPRRGKSRDDNFFALQEGFLDYHLRNVSARYDFDSIRVGVQPFSSDFRGFLFQDQALGVRLFGNRANNRYQYNFAWFRRIEKDTNSGLNDLSQPLRRDDVFAANLYVQDMPLHGFTSQVTAIHNRNHETGFHYDRNGFLVRPASLGFENGHAYEVTYLGYNGDGHFGRFNLSLSAYYAVGSDRKNPFTNQRADISSYFIAAEPSYDMDWLRIRGSFAHASGQKDPFSKTESGFDAILENPQFAGADASYWIRQSIPLIGGGGVALSGRNGMLPSLRSSKDEGQSNFINPGLFLIGVGADADLLPQLRLSGNINKLYFAETGVLEVLRQQGNISNDIGTDFSVALTYKPFQTQNFLMRLSAAMLLPGRGFRDLYDSEPPNRIYYSVLGNIVLTY
jgi:hypothetical protein